MVHSLPFFEAPTGPADPQSPKAPPQQKGYSQNPKIFENPPGVNLISPKVNLISPQLNLISQQKTLSIFREVLEEFKIFEIFCWGVTVKGVPKISSQWFSGGAKAQISTATLACKSVLDRLANLPLSQEPRKGSFSKRGFSQNPVSSR